MLWAFSAASIPKAHRRTQRKPADRRSCRRSNFITSDIPAVLTHTRRVLQLSDHELVRLTRDKVEVFDSAGLPVDKMETVVSWDISSAEKGGYAHFMIKEIMEQPQAISATISPASALTAALYSMASV